MRFSVLYFASIKENLNCTNEVIEQANIATVTDLVAHLSQRGQLWQQILTQNTVMVAVNQTVADLQTELSDGDEVAFFPPVTGG